ncbi:hypothetical protein PR048_021755 [Dryococelus australis]|uniref:DDE-1 domain-containing protein n=1 Tax=Dryococelus australis TaxID=614101 RepID=A0ABQ9GZ59_9NEOP|nr:hypothetical protein PR048_021755 [Dryococelus australis]
MAAQVFPRVTGLLIVAWLEGGLYDASPVSHEFWHVSVFLTVNVCQAQRDALDAENLSYGRLVRFNEEIVSTHFELLVKTLDKMNLHNQLTYNCSQLVLAEKSCKRVHAATRGEKGETATVVACTNATGTNWIPPMISYKGKYSKKEFGDNLTNGNVFAVTPKGYITKEEFCNLLSHFNSHRITGKAWLIFDGHHSHLDNSVLDVSESLGIQLFCLPANCSHELQPLYKSFFKSLKVYWTSAVDNFRRKDPGRLLGICLLKPGHNAIAQREYGRSRNMQCYEICIIGLATGVIVPSLRDEREQSRSETIRRMVALTAGEEKYISRYPGTGTGWEGQRGKLKKIVNIVLRLKARAFYGRNKNLVNRKCPVLYTAGDYYHEALANKYTILPMKVERGEYGATPGETGYSRENPPTSGIVRHDSSMRKSGSDPAPGIEPGSLRPRGTDSLVCYIGNTPPVTDNHQPRGGGGREVKEEVREESAANKHEKNTPTIPLSPPLRRLPTSEISDTSYFKATGSNPREIKVGRPSISLPALTKSSITTENIPVLPKGHTAPQPPNSRRGKGIASPQRGGEGGGGRNRLMEALTRSKAKTWCARTRATLIIEVPRPSPSETKCVVWPGFYPTLVLLQGTTGAGCGSPPGLSIRVEISPDLLQYTVQAFIRTVFGGCDIPPVSAKRAALSVHCGLRLCTRWRILFMPLPAIQVLIRAMAGSSFDTETFILEVQERIAI